MIEIVNNVFHLSDGKFSYAFAVKEGKLVHTYFGRALRMPRDRMTSGIFCGEKGECRGSDWELFEMSEQGRGDFRLPAVVVRGAKSASTDFKVASYEILAGKPDLGMPALRGRAETLVVHLFDDVADVSMDLFYTVYDGALARHAVIHNRGKEHISLCAADSLCVDFDGGDYDLLTLDGRWGSECNVTRNAVRSGIHTVSSTRGLTSHQHNPFVAVLEKTASEESGEAFGFNLIYSGNFAIRAESDEKCQLRVCMGVNLLEGGITLEAGESFTTPEGVAVYSDGGLGGMSRTFHRLYRTRLIDPRFADRIRPIVVNSWESAYFDFDENKLLAFIDGAKGLGIDTVVLDDGWFGGRDSDDSSLGDWVVDRRKLPSGLDALIDRCKANGLKFGIWFEPEAISPDSDLYRAHPEYALSTCGRDGKQMRNQFMLDFSRGDVVDCVYSAMYKILSEHDIAYVKWDANRPLSDVCDVKKYIGYVKGVYDLYARLTAAFPDVLIEGCSSGGGRFDPAILYYSPMIWASDDTDAVERAKIQYGLSLCYPLQTMSNHVSVCPNHQTGRMTPFHSRGAVAMLGCLGYELNVATASDEERAEIKAQVDFYRRNAELILTGDLYRLLSPFDDGAFCEQVVSEDKSRSLAVYMRPLNTPNLPIRKIKLRGLDEQALYRIEDRDEIMSGGELMYCGIRPKVERDFGAEVFRIEKIKS